MIDWLPPQCRAHLVLLLALLPTAVLFPDAAQAESLGKSRAEVERVPDALEDSGPGNGVYGRFDANFSCSAGLGASYQSAGSELMPSVKISARFYQTVGAFVGFSQAVSDSPSLARSLELGLLVEPLFLLRFSRDAAFGFPLWDLMLDSLSLSLAAQLAEVRPGQLGDQAGFSVGLGLGVPLLARANGPWARVRGTVQTGYDSPEATAELLLEWQWMLSVLERHPD